LQFRKIHRFFYHDHHTIQPLIQWRMSMTPPNYPDLDPTENVNDMLQILVFILFPKSQEPFLPTLLYLISKIVGSRFPRSQTPSSSNSDALCLPFSNSTRHFFSLPPSFPDFNPTNNTYDMAHTLIFLLILFHKTP
jgi:hypothetical protein